MGFDAVLIPGGGLTPAGEPLPWVCTRLDAAIAVPDEPLLIPLSVGSVHKPVPVPESIAAARYLMNRGVTRERILVDTWSLDTIGNAYFALRMHCEPRALRRLLVINSAFHMPRTKAIFDWVFSLSKDSFALEYRTVSDATMAADALAARLEKERASLVRVAELRQRLDTLDRLHEFLFTEHEAYANGLKSTQPIGEWLKSY